MTFPVLAVIDDEPEITELVASVGEMVGYEVQVANEPAGFREIVAATEPSVIVMDIVMPGTDGIELLQWLADVGCAAPIVLISGYTELYLRTAKTLGTAKGLQFAGSLVKPFTIADLKATLAKTFRERRALSDHQA